MATYLDWNPSKDNDFVSPKYLWEDIKDYIPQDKIISMPFYCEGSAGIDMADLGFNVIHQNEDFFEHDRGEVVIDNPPFELKKEVINKLVERNKPFILIVPVSTLCYKYTKILVDDLQGIIPKKRMKFIHYDKKKKELKADWQKHSSRFDCVYMCWKMQLSKDIIFI